MYRITNLNRVNFQNGILILFVYLKKFFRLELTNFQKAKLEYYHMLIYSNGKQKNRNILKIVSSLTKNTIQVKLREWPSSDASVCNQIFVKEEYKAVINVFKRNFDSKKLFIIDGGANIGLTSLFFNMFFPSSKIIAIEPDAGNIEILTFNFNNNKIDAIINQGGIWPTNSYLKTVKDFRDKKEWSTRVFETKEEGLQGFTINSIIETNNWRYVDILKIDIEGAEKEVFLSEKVDLSFLERTKCIVIEIHDEFNCRESIYKILDEYNFEYSNSGELTIGINKSFAKI